VVQFIIFFHLWALLLVSSITIFSCPTLQRFFSYFSHFFFCLTCKLQIHD
jgi:hypothetical protein